MKKSSLLGYLIAFLLAAGVITTLLVVLMVPLESNSPTPTSTPTPTKPTPTTSTLPIITTTMEPELPTPGNFTYTNVPGFGMLKAKKSSQGPAIFAAVPYAEPPVKELRWTNPQPAPPLTPGQYYDSTKAKPACPQLCTLPSPEYVCPKEMNEDCLYVAVYVPSKLTERVDSGDDYYFTLTSNVTSANLPVMVFFHGGAFITGGNGVLLYDGRFIAEKGEVIVVTVNYRLGPFGFLYQDDGSETAARGNFAIYDQIEALKWVKKYIRNFGGNPNSVTIFGQSAGAQSVAIHLVNDISEPLFHYAILQSNPFGLSFKTPEEAQKIGNRFVRYMTRNDSEIDCRPNQLDCLRNISEEKILDLLKSFPILGQVNINSFTQLFEPWSPVIESELLPKHPFYLFKEGNFQNKPMIHGFTTDEGVFFIAQVLAEPSKDYDQYTLFLRALFGSNASLVEEKYPPQCGNVTLPPPAVNVSYPEVDCDNRESLDDWVTDWLFTCPTRRVFNSEDRFGDETLPVWQYTFDQLWSFPEFWDNYTVCYNLTCHAAELPYLFDIDTLTNFRFTAAEQELAEKLIFYWTNFAKYGNPNPPSEPRRLLKQPKSMMEKEIRTVFPNVQHWPRIYEGLNNVEGSIEAEYKTMLLTASGEKVENDFQKEICDFWDENDFYLEDSLKLGEIEKEKFLRLIKIHKENVKSKSKAETAV